MCNPDMLVTAVRGRLRASPPAERRVTEAPRTQRIPHRRSPRRGRDGSLVTAQNTVPLTIWVAAQHLADYPAAITTCIAADVDIDTMSAIVGGIVAACTGAGARPGPIVGVPQTWLAAREPLPGWFEPVRRT
ncbi:ADP-ribosylglycohydrolase family protein [Nocardia gipuzkoensis]